MIPTTRPTIKPVLLPEDFAAAAVGEEVAAADVEDAELELEVDDEVVALAFSELTAAAAECAASMKLLSAIPLDVVSCAMPPMALESATAIESSIRCCILGCFWLSDWIKGPDVRRRAKRKQDLMVS